MMADVLELSMSDVKKTQQRNPLSQQQSNQPRTQEAAVPLPITLLVAAPAVNNSSFQEIVKRFLFSNFHNTIKNCPGLLLHG